jgi:hypothetical protein
MGTKLWSRLAQPLRLSRPAIIQTDRKLRNRLTLHPWNPRKFSEFEEIAWLITILALTSPPFDLVNPDGRASTASPFAP